MVQIIVKFYDISGAYSKFMNSITAHNSNTTNPCAVSHRDSLLPSTGCFLSVKSRLTVFQAS